MTRTPFPGLSQKGIALPLVLWTVTVLMAVVFAFAFSARTEVRMTMNFRGSIEKKFLAEAGVERALMELSYRNFFRDTAPAEPDFAVWKVDSTLRSEALGKGGYRVSIVDESGKISINGLTDANAVVLKNLLVRLEVPPAAADIIVDSILDWKDGDDLHRLNGAESDYYMSLPNPYKAKDRKFDTPEELLLVKGVTEEILFGDGKTKGLSQFITVFSEQKGVSLASSPRDVLLSIPGMTDELAESILSYRKDNPVWDDAKAEVFLGPVVSAIRPYTTQGAQRTYTITSWGYKDGEKGEYAIVATVILLEASYKYLYYKSPAWVQQS
jgi:general secretion pathway protein K